VSRTYSHRPDALAAWIGLKDAVTSTMDRRRYELVTIAAARRVRSSYCMLAHGNVLADKFYDAAACARSRSTTTQRASTRSTS
jgi:hypothetical protein